MRRHGTIKIEYCAERLPILFHNRHHPGLPILIRGWRTLEQLGDTHNNGKIKTLRWTSKTPSSCAQETLFSAMEAVAPALEGATKEGATMSLRTGRKKKLLRGGKILKLMKLPKKAFKCSERTRTAHPEYSQDNQKLFRALKNVKFETSQIKPNFKEKFTIPKIHLSPGP